MDPSVGRVDRIHRVTADRHRRAVRGLDCGCRDAGGEDEQPGCDQNDQTSTPAGLGVAFGVERASLCPCCRSCQFRVVFEDGSLEMLESVARLESQFVDEQPPSLPEHLEGLGLPARPVERKHQLPAEVLAQRVLANECLQFGHESGVLPQGEVGIDSGFEGTETQPLQPAPLSLQHRSVGEVCERRAAPERESLPKPAGRIRRILAAGRRHEQIETLHVEPALLDMDQIAGRSRDDQIPTERRPKLRHIHL